MVRVSPHHQIDLAEALRPMIGRPPAHDFVIRRLARKTANQEPLVQSELVVAGADTLALYPLAREYPVHFRKTYYPICFHQDPSLEFENQLAASRAIDVPPPIGCTRTSFRSCFIPGRAYSALSPFGVQPEDANIRIAREADPAALIGLWHLLGAVHEQVLRLHEHGVAHGDLFLHNVIVSFFPLGAHLIDFEQARLRDRPAAPRPAPWEEACAADLREILREALCIQCGLGRQAGPLAGASLAALPSLFADPGRFDRALDEAGTRHR